MYARRLIGLTLAVGVLAYLALRGAGEDPRANGIGVLAEPLFAGLDPARVERIEVEYLDRGARVVVERRGLLSWRVVEPYRSRALGSLADQLAELAGRTMAEPREGFEDSAVGLDAPVVRLTFAERLSEDAEPRTWTLELGDPELDGQRMYARRAEGEVLRVPRAFQSYVDVGPANWRDKRLLGVSQRSILGFVRSGALPNEAGFVDPERAGELTYSVQLDAEGWWVVDPVRVRLDASAIESLRVVLANFAGRAVLETEGEGLSGLGLAPPAFGYRVELRDGSFATLEFGRFRDGVAGSSWSVQRQRDDEREEGGVVYEALESDVRLLTGDFRALLDRDPFALAMRELGGVELRLGDERLLLERPSGLWWASDPDARAETAVRADNTLALALAQRVVDAEFDDFLSVEASSLLSPEGSVRVALLDGTVLQGELGPLVDVAGSVVEPGTEGAARSFRREGEELWGMLGEDLGEIAGFVPDQLQSRNVTRESELDLAWITLESQDRRRSWRRDADRGFWSEQGETQEDRSFALAIDALLNVEVEAWRSQSVELDPGRRYTVRIERLDGGVIEYAVGEIEVDGEARVLLEQGGRQGGVPRRLYEGVAEFLR